MTIRIEWKGNDGVFLTGGHPLTIGFTCENSFLDRMISNFYTDTDGLDRLVTETAGELSGHVSIDLDDYPEEDDDFEEDDGHDRDEGYDHLAPYRYDAEGCLLYTSPSPRD